MYHETYACVDLAMYVDTDVLDLCIMCGLRFDFRRFVVARMLMFLYLCYVKVCDMVDYYDWYSYWVGLHFVDVDSELVLVDFYEKIYGEVFNALDVI